MRKRKPSMKTLLGITKAKRRVAKMTGIPTTKSGRKRKALNMVTGGGYGKYQRARAAVNRPYKSVKRTASCMGCLVYTCSMAVFAVAVAMMILW